MGWTQKEEGQSFCDDPGGIKPENCGDDEYWVPDKFPNKDEAAQAGCEDCPDGGSCLGAIGGDEEIEVVASSRDKNRLRKDYDASSNGGYRDVQLCVRLNTAEARTRGVRHHLAEVQLHLSAIAALKTGGGHAMYVLCRNLDGR